jgi:VCBS repeat-containing protein
MNTPQAVDDYYAVYEDCIYSFDVMANDLGGNAKILWSIDDTAMKDDSGTGTYDLLSQDAACVPELSDKGARIWIESGKIRYDASVFNYLGVGESVCDKFTYAIRMSNGTLSWATVTITISGTNDGPDIRVGSGDIGSAGLNETNAGLCKTGTLTVTDPDNSDTVSTTIALTSATGPTGGPSNATLESMFSVTPASGLAANTSDANNLTWKFDSGSEAFNYLRAGQTLQLVYTLTVSDGNGGTDTQTVVITITGTNDAPVLSDTTDPSAVLEAGDASAQNLAAITGSFSVTDKDVGDTLTASVVGSPAVQLNGVAFGGAPAALTAAGAFSLDPAFLSSGGAQSVGYSYDPGAANLDFLRAGDSLTITYTVQVGDGTTTSNTQTVTFTITGTNDAPVLTGDLAAPINEGGTYQLTTADVNFADPDDGASDVTFTVGGLSNGTLYVNGIAATSFTGQQLADGLVTFTHNGSETLTAGFNISVEDGDEDSSAPVAQPFNFTVSPVNDAPVNTVPGGQSVNEDQTLVFSAGNGNAISISDVDAGSSTVQVTLSVASGTLTLGSLVGLTVTAGANGSSTVTVQGTQPAINAGLQGLTYQGNLNFNGGDSLSVVTSDLGNSGSGGTLTDTDNVAITVNAVNDAPVNTVPGGQSVNEDQTLVFSTGNGNAISIGDVDAGSNIVQVALSVASGTLTLGALTGLTVTAGANGTSTVTVQGTLADINAALQGLTYQGNLNFNGGDSLSIVTSDLGNSGSGGALMDSDSVAITINAVNDAPVNNTPASFSTNEDNALKLAGLSVTDVDAGAGGISVRLSVASGTLSAANAGGVTVSGSGSGSITLSGTLAAINTYLATVANQPTYTPVANANGPVTLTMTTNDGGNTGSGGAQSDTDNVTITINAVNDAPVASPVTLSAIAEDSGPRIITQAELLAGVTDIDGPSLSITALSIATGVGSLISNGNGTWTYTPALDDDTSVTFNYTASDGSLTANSTATMDITPVADGAPPTDITFTLAASTGSLSGNGINTGMTLGSLSAVDPDSSSWTFTLGTVSGQLFPAVTVSPTSGGSVTLVTNGSVAAGNYQFTVTASDAQGQSFTETYTLSVGTTGGDNTAFFTITAGTDISLGLNGGDQINGGGGDDALVGGQNTDTLNGGLGNDQLVGGAGGDFFLFNTALSGTTNVDRILDFDASGGGNGDHIQLDDAIFTQLSVGTLSAANFASNAGGNATDANDYILYDTATGNLYYDADGNGAGAKVLFATLTVSAGTIDPTDILIV